MSEVSGWVGEWVCLLLVVVPRLRFGILQVMLIGIVPRGTMLILLVLLQLGLRRCVCWGLECDGKGFSRISPILLSFINCNNIDALTLTLILNPNLILTLTMYL